MPSSITTTCLTVAKLGTSGNSSGRERPVDEDHLVLGVVDDVGELLGKEPDVEGVEDPSSAWSGEVELEVAAGVPRERAHPALIADAERVEQAAEPAGASRPLLVVDPLDAVGGGGGHALVEEQPFGPVEEVHQRQRVVLHRALHASPSSSPRPVVPVSSAS